MNSDTLAASMGDGAIVQPQENRMKVWKNLLVLTLALSPAMLSTSIADAQRRPVIEQLRPRSGPPGTELTLIGRGLDSRTQLSLGGQPMVVRSRTPNRWVVVVPDGARTGAIVISSAAGRFRGPTFRVVAAAQIPSVAGMDPAFGTVGTVVTIRGENFGVRPTVRLGERRVVVRQATPTQIQVVVPRGATSGRFEIRVGSAVTESPSFTIGAGLAISRVERPSATELAIHGTGFSANPSDNFVSLGGRALRVASATPVRLFVILPSRIRSDDLVVRVAGVGRTFASLSGAQGPTIRSLSAPALASGQTLRIEGEGFGTDVRRIRATIGGHNIPVVAAGGSSIDIVLPRRRPSGILRGLRVEIAGQNVQGVPDFEWLQPLRIRDVRPLQGAVGTEVTIRGVGFAPTREGNIVLLSGVAQEVLRATATEIRVRIVEARSGAFQVQSGGAIDRYSRPFVLQSTPSISGITPMSGAPGSEVTIRGANFGTRQALVRVTMGRTPMEITRFSATEIRARVPGGVAGGSIGVQVGTQGRAAGQGQFRVTTSQRVHSMEPASAYPGVELTFRGRGFPRGVTQVQFQGARAVPAQRISPVELRVVVPRRSRTGAVQLILPGGATLEAGDLTVVATPQGIAVERVEPECVNPGCIVVLRGHGFSTRARRNNVTFEGTRVEVVSASAQALRVRLPATAANGRFTVQVRRARAESPPFIIVPATR